MGYLRMAREVAPHMTAAGWGRIINISGLAARQTGSIIGSIRNVAVAALTKNLADELGPKGINVTVVHPGLTQTEKTGPLVAARAEAAGLTPEAVEERMAANITIGRAEENDLVIKGSLISRLHARVEINRNKFMLVDQSTNGTFVLGKDGEEAFVRRDSMQIRGEGLIGLGKAPDSNSSQVIR